MRSVAFAVPAEVAFDYLAEPRNRPEWQSSLARVEIDPDWSTSADPPAVGLSWVDVTRLGFRPRMRLVQVDRPEMWSEWGEWRDGVRARLTLAFVPTAEGCLVVPDLSLGIDGWFGSRVAGVLRRLAELAVPRDLERAARILSERSAGH